MKIGGWWSVFNKRYAQRCWIFDSSFSLHQSHSETISNLFCLLLVDYFDRDSIFYDFALLEIECITVL